MTYIDNWDEFAIAAEQLFLSNPAKTTELNLAGLNLSGVRTHVQETRFTTKYRSCDGKLVLKMTDDKVCLKYRTEQAQDVRKLEKLNNMLMRHMTSK